MINRFSHTELMLFLSRHYEHCDALIVDAIARDSSAEAHEYRVQKEDFNRAMQTVYKLLPKESREQVDEEVEALWREQEKQRVWEKNGGTAASFNDVVKRNQEVANQMYKDLVKQTELNQVFNSYFEKPSVEKESNG